MPASNFIVSSFVLVHEFFFVGGSGVSCSSAKYFDVKKVFRRNHCIICGIIASFEPHFVEVKVFAPT